MTKHKTRFSDSSTMDEICIYCGAYDGPFHRGLNGPCRVDNPDERREREQADLRWRQKATEDWNRITGDNKPIPEE